MRSVVRHSLPFCLHGVQPPGVASQRIFRILHLSHAWPVRVEPVFLFLGGGPSFVLTVLVGSPCVACPGGGGAAAAGGTAGAVAMAAAAASS